MVNIVNASLPRASECLTAMGFKAKESLIHVVFCAMRSQLAEQTTPASFAISDLVAMVALPAFGRGLR